MPQKNISCVFSKKRIAVAIALILANQAYSGPEGGVVVGGTGSIREGDRVTTVNQDTDRMAIDWQSYDVNVDERVEYIQPSSSSISLNRILSNSGSTIQGRIDANGQVILVNPNGIIFTESATVNVGGILASGLSIDPQDFLNGDFALSSLEDKDGTVINSGVINASIGGSVSLIGSSVENNGLISAELGEVNLLSGKEAVVQFDNDGFFRFAVTEESLNEIGVTNRGEIDSVGGKVLLTGSVSQDIFSGAVNTDTIESARSIVVDENGDVFLAGGNDVVNEGVINVSGNIGGSVVAVGENAINTGSIKADGRVAGAIEIYSENTTILSGQSVLSAHSSEGQGGDIRVLGNRVGILDESKIIASGAYSGGEVLIGGDVRGENVFVPNSSSVFFSRNAEITSNAILSGSAGKIILFSNDSLRAYGTINAFGFGLADGGFIETSSDAVQLDLTINVGSELGEIGRWLIDPWNIEITNASDGLTPSSNSDYDSIFSPVDADSIVTTQSVSQALVGGSNVLIETGGDILLSSDLNYNGANHSSLTLSAHGDIKIEGNISDGDSDVIDKLDLTLIADSDSSRNGSVFINNHFIETNGGDVTLFGENVELGFQSYTNTELVESTAFINTAGGAFNAFTRGYFELYTSIVTAGGNVTIGGDHDSLLETPDTLPNSFTAFFNKRLLNAIQYHQTIGTINTSSPSRSISIKGGNISISTVQDGTENGDVVLGNLHVSGSIGAGASDIQGVVIDVVSANDIILANAFNYDQMTEWNSQTETGYTNREFSLSAQNSIFINGRIYDSNGSALDTLNISLIADSDSSGVGNIEINANIYTAGGDVSLSGVNLDSRTGTINTNLANSTENSTSTAGGDLTINMAGNINLGDVTLDADTISTTSIDGDDIFIRGTINSNRANVNIASVNTSVLGSIQTQALNANQNGGNVTISVANEFTLNGSIIASGHGNGLGGIVNIRGNSLGNTYTINSGSNVVGRELILNGSTGDTQAGNDVFNISEDLNAVINAGAGNDTFNIYTNVNNSVLDGGVGDDIFNVRTSGIEFSIADGSGANTLSAFSDPTNSNTWNIDTQNTLTNNNGVITFSGIHILSGGDHADTSDTFIVNANFTGRILGNAGNDTFTLTASVSDNDVTTAYDIEGGEGADRVEVFDPTINVTVSGQNGSDEIHVSYGETATWSINQNTQIVESQSLGTITFSGFEVARGSNTHSDTFNITANTVTEFHGRGGNDRFLFDNPSQAIALISGGIGNDTLEIQSNHDAAQREWNIVGIDSGSVVGAVDAFNDIENLTGGAGRDRFSFGIEDVDTGLYDATGTALSGLINGGEAGANEIVTDLLNVMGYLEGVVVEFGEPFDIGTIVEGTETLPNVNVVNVERIGAASASELNHQGADNWLTPVHNADLKWEVAPMNGGYVVELDNFDTEDVSEIVNTRIDFTNFGSIQGGIGGGEDANIIDNRNITGEYRSGGGRRILRYGGITGFVFVELSETNIISIQGNGNTLVRVSETTPELNILNEWTINASNSGNLLVPGYIDPNTETPLNVELTGVNQLQGGLGNDIFSFMSSGELLNGSIHGGNNGTNTISSASTESQQFTLNTIQANVPVTGTSYPKNIDSVDALGNTSGYTDIYGISTIQGNGAATVNTRLRSAESGNFRWTIGATRDGSTLTNLDTSETLYFENMDAVFGGDANDTFRILSLNGVENSFSGGGGNDSINFEDLQGSLSISLDSNIAGSIDYYVSDIESITTLENNHRIYGPNLISTWTINERNAGTIEYSDSGAFQSVAFSSIPNLIGNANSDSFYFESNGMLTGAIHGGTSTQNAQDLIEVRNSSALDFYFSLSALDANANVINTGEDQVSIYEIESVTANTSSTQSNTLSAVVSSNNRWDINSSQSMLQDTTHGTTLEFSGITDLRGGNQQDTFIFDGATVAGIVDGRAQAIGSNDRVSILNMVDSSVEIGNRQTENINIVNIEEVEALATGNRLIGDNGENNWIIRGVNAGNVNDVLFSGFEHLEGGSGNDNFYLSRQVGATTDDQITGSIHGGVNNQRNSSRDAVDVTGVVNPLVVSLSETVNSDLYIVNIENVTATDNGNTLIGAETPNTFTINGLNQGTVNSTEFIGFENLVGRDYIDQFIYGVNGRVAGVIDGGGQGPEEFDLVDVRAVRDATVQLDRIPGGVVDIEQIVGSGLGSSLYASDSFNRWNIIDIDGGSIVDAENHQVQFSGFSDIYGGSLRDEFTISGLVSGGINAGSGDDSFRIDIDSLLLGNMVIQGGADQDTITFVGGNSSNRYMQNYDALANGLVTHTYVASNSNASEAQSVSYQTIETVYDDVFASDLSIRTVLNLGDQIGLGNGAFGLDGFTAINYSNKDNISIIGEQLDTLNIASDFSIAGNLTVENTDLNISESITLNASQVAFTNTSGFGSDLNPLNTNTNDLQLVSTRGNVFISNTGTINISALSNPSGVIFIQSTGSITDSSPMQSNQELSLVSSENIVLDNDNAISGQLNLTANGGSVVLTNGATNLGTVSTRNLTINSSSNIDDSGALTIAGVLMLNGGTGNIILDHEANSFQNVVVNGAGSVSISENDNDGIEVAANSVNENLSIRSNQEIVSRAIEAGRLTLTSVGSSITLQDRVQAENSVQLTGQGISINGLVNVNSSVGGYAVLIDGQSGDLNINAPVEANNGVPGNVRLLGDSIAIGTNASVSGLNVLALANGNIAVNSIITAGNLLSLHSNNGEISILGENTILRANGIDLIATNDIISQEIISDSLEVESSLGSFSQRGDITLSGGDFSVVVAGSYALESSSVLTMSSGIYSVDASSIVIDGMVNAHGVDTSFIVDDSLTLNSGFNSESFYSEIGGQFSMSLYAELSASELVEMSVESDALLGRMASENGDIQLTVNGSVIDNNSDALNLAAGRLYVRSNSGFGNASNFIETSVQALDLVNVSDEVAILNDRTLQVDALINSGNIDLTNSAGNVTLFNSNQADYDLSQTGTLAAGGVIDANYDVGTITIRIPNGYLAALPQRALSRRPEIIAYELDVRTELGFGYGGRQIVLLINRYGFIGGRGSRPLWAFRMPPELPLGTDGDLFDLSFTGSNSDLLVVVKPDDDLDPNVFSNIRNYRMDSPAIRLPDDQLFPEDKEKGQWN